MDFATRVGHFSERFGANRRASDRILMIKKQKKKNVFAAYMEIEIRKAEDISLYGYIPNAVYLGGGGVSKKFIFNKAIGRFSPSFRIVSVFYEKN